MPLIIIYCFAIFYTPPYATSYAKCSGGQRKLWMACLVFKNLYFSCQNDNAMAGKLDAFFGRKIFDVGF